MPPDSRSTSVGVAPDGSLELVEPQSLPDVLDILVVGGGPAGTAAAFRAKELGLAVSVVEHDDILTRIRDYDKQKPIKPDFGAGRQMGFPAGGHLIAALRFADIDKDDLHQGWRRLYCQHSVPARVGVELMGLTSADQATWRAELKNHNTQATEFVHARHVVLALGGGMPRRLDIPGNVDAVATRLNAPERFAGEPACVIGGGTSAAEAIIAISKAKKAAEDGTSVYWSYRGDKMPAVSEALAPELFHATNVNGNVRYLPGSEAVALVKGPDGQERLRMEVDRKALPGRPIETMLLEFSVASCVACIGQELPMRLLNALGIYAVTGGPRNRKAFALTPLLETVVPRVYIVGDTLNPAYLECTSFDADPSAFEERPHRGNIKRALTDGVIVAEAIAQTLKGCTVIQVAIPIAPSQEGVARVSAEPRRPAAAAAREPRPADAVLVRLLQDGVEAEQFSLTPGGATSIGRAGCDVSFDADSALADHHASIRSTADGYVLEGHSNKGVFLRVTEDRPRRIQPNAVIRLGQQWLLFGDARDPLSFSHYSLPDGRFTPYHLREGTTVLGRDAPGITLAPSDHTLSRRHAAVTVRGDEITLRDLKSANGTYLKADGLILLEDGDEIRLGYQTLRFMRLAPARVATKIAFDASGIRRAAPAERSTAATEQASPAPTPTGPAVTFQSTGQTCPVRPGQSICEVAESQGVQISADCHSGICGSDPVEVLDGHEHLNPMGSGERSTLEDICGLDPARHRLACVARPTGPVVVALREP